MEYIVLKMILSLAAVIGLMVAVLFVMRRFMNGGRAESSNAVPIEVLGMRNFQQKRSIYVLRVLDKVIVVGATDSAMQTLAELGDAKSMKKLDTVLAEADRVDARPKWFSWGKSDDETISMPFSGLLARHMNIPAPAGKSKKLSR